MNILIIGSGVTGGLLGARLVEHGEAVTFVVRPTRKVELLTQGLRLTSHYGGFRRPVNAITIEELRGVYDLIIVACRAQDYENVLQAAALAFGETTIVLPLLEGAAQMQPELIPHGARLIGGLFEARMTIDADGILRQRTPSAELSIGALGSAHIPELDSIASLLSGRGIKTSVVEGIESAIWARFCFSAAAVAMNALTKLSLRDAVPSTHHITSFDKMLTEGAAVGSAIGVQVRIMDVLRYRRSFRLETRPVQPPPLLNEGGRGADESAYVLLEMVSLAERAKVPVAKLRRGRDALLRPREIELQALDMADDAATA